MALIAPTDYDLDSLVGLQAGNQIKYDAWEKILNNVHMSLLAEQMVISDQFTTQETTSAAYVSARRFPLDTIDTCDYDGGATLTHKWYVRARVSAVGTVATVRVVSGADSDTVFVSGTTWDWVYGGEIDLTTNGVEDYLDLDFLRNAGSGTCYLCGLLLLATPQ